MGAQTADPSPARRKEPVLRALDSALLRDSVSVSKQGQLWTPSPTPSGCSCVGAAPSHTQSEHSGVAAGCADPLYPARAVAACAS